MNLRRQSRYLGPLVCAFTAAITLGACGGGSASNSSGGPSANPRAVPGGLPPNTSAARQAVTGRDTKSGTRVSTKNGTGGKATGGKSSGGSTGTNSSTPVSRLRAHGTNPCSYITASDAKKAFHATSVRKTEGPLGPTCIFTIGGGRQLGTLAVDVTNVPVQVKRMHDPQRVRIGVHTGYCGRLGSPLFLLPISKRRALVITAPCSQARVLAARALPRIRA